MISGTLLSPTFTLPAGHIAEFYPRAPKPPESHLVATPPATTNSFGTLQIYSEKQIVVEWQIFDKAPRILRYQVPVAQQVRICAQFEQIEPACGFIYCPDTVLQEGATLVFFEAEQIDIVPPQQLSAYFATEVLRPQQHLSAPRNWMNDPNGLCYFQGYYHAFYQTYPHDCQWGPMHWGHWVSEDLITWKPLPYALFPHPSVYYEDKRIGGIFSGGAVVRQVHGRERLYVFFTRHYSDKKETRLPYWESQEAAWSEDGVHFYPSHYNPLVPSLPRNSTNPAFRDPSIFPQQEQQASAFLAAEGYQMLLAGAEHNQPAIFRFQSENLDIWRDCGVFCDLSQYHNFYAWSSECPGYFQQNGYQVLMYSMMLIDPPQSSERRHVSYAGLSELNEGADYMSDSIQLQRIHELDFSSTYYAPQLFYDAKKDRILLISWFHNRKSDNFATGDGAQMHHCGSLSVPRELRIGRNAAGELHLYQEPIAELQNLRSSELTAKAGCITLPAASTGSCEVLLQAEADNYQVRWQYQNGEIQFHKTGNECLLSWGYHSTAAPAEQYSYTLNENEDSSLQAFADRGVIEVILSKGLITGALVHNLVQLQQVQFRGATGTAYLLYSIFSSTSL